MRPGNFQDGTFEKIIITVAEITLIQVSFLNVGSKQKKIKMNTRNTIAFILFKSQIC